MIDNPQISALTKDSGLGMAFKQHPIIPVYDIMGNFAGTRANDLGEMIKTQLLYKIVSKTTGTAIPDYLEIYLENML